MTIVHFIHSLQAPFFFLHSSFAHYLHCVSALYLCHLFNLFSLLSVLNFLLLCLCPHFSLPFFRRCVPCFCRRGVLRHARSTFCDGPSAFQWKPSFQNSTASCPLRAVSSPRTYLCSNQDTNTHTQTRTHTRTLTHWKYLNCFLEAI